MDANLTSAPHLHVLINHLPIIGLGTALLALVLGLVVRNRPAQLIALGLIFLTAASAWPVMLTGNAAYKAVYKMADDDGADWLDEHMDRGEKAAPVFYALAVLALIAALAPLRWPRSAFPLSALTILLTLAALGAGSWVALAGGQIRHPEFRSAAPAATP